MSCNNYLSPYTCYSTCYTGCGTSCWPVSCCNPCTTISCNPASTVVCPNPCNPCPTIIYSATVGTTIAIPSGGGEIPGGSTIPAGSTTVPAGTVTVITPYLNVISFQGGITVLNGFFTVPCSGQYLITTVGCFTTAGTTTAGDFRKLYIYSVDHVSGLVTLQAEESVVPIPTGPNGTTTGHTCLNLSYIVDLKANDRVFIAARQVTQLGDTTVVNLSANTRTAIKRL